MFFFTLKKKKMIIERFIGETKRVFYDIAVKTSFWNLYFRSVLILNACSYFLN